MANRRRAQKPKQKVGQVARTRGVYAVRRFVSDSSHKLFESVNKEMLPELENTGRLFTPDSLGVTVVGFSQFTSDIIRKGPNTDSIIAEQNSAQGPLAVEIGRLGIFGSGNKHKLAFRIESPELYREHRELEDLYAEQKYPLAEIPYDDGFVPHCSIALMFGEHVEHYRDKRTLARLDTVAGLMGQYVMLDPAVRND